MSTEKFDRAVKSLIEKKLNREIFAIEEDRLVGNLHYFDVCDGDDHHEKVKLSSFEIAKALKDID